MSKKYPIGHPKWPALDAEFRYVLDRNGVILSWPRDRLSPMVLRNRKYLRWLKAWGQLSVMPSNVIERCDAQVLEHKYRTLRAAFEYSDVGSYPWPRK